MSFWLKPLWVALFVSCSWMRSNWYTNEWKTYCLLLIEKWKENKWISATSCPKFPVYIWPKPIYQLLLKMMTSLQNGHPKGYDEIKDWSFIFSRLYLLKFSKTLKTFHGVKKRRKEKKKRKREVVGEFSNKLFFVYKRPSL